MVQLCFWTKIRTKQWLVLSAAAFKCMRTGFLFLITFHQWLHEYCPLNRQLSLAWWSITIAIDCNGLSFLIFEANVCMRLFCAPNETILLVYIPANNKMSFIWKDEVFFAKIGIFCKSIAGLLFSVFQAYTQPYSFGGRIKLIICQIRHEISTSWKK